MQLSEDALYRLHRDMILVRLFESRVSEAFKTGAVSGFIHAGIGREACVAGVSFVTKDGDTVGATHRECGVLLCRGSDPGKVMAEIYGKSTGYCKGKGGYMYVCDLKRGSLVNNAIPGSGQTIINGYAIANKMRKNDNIAITILSDGAANRGEFHEGISLAAIWKLPTIFVVFDDGYARPVRARSYGVPGVTADGNDIFAVIDAMNEAVLRARAGGGPSFVELKTYRRQGWIKNDDPIERFEKTLQDRGVFNEDIKAAAWDEMRAVIDRAQKFAEESPYPDIGEIYTDVYFDKGKAVR